jgi:hypothetical protein
VARHPARPISIASFDQVIGLDGLLRNGVGRALDPPDQESLEIASTRVASSTANLTVPSDATK